MESLINKAPGQNKNHLKVSERDDVGALAPGPGFSVAEPRDGCASSTQRGALTRLAIAVPLQPKTGLPISPYFSAVKLRWLLDNVEEVRLAVRSQRAMFGTVDSWIIWVRQRPRFLWLTAERLGRGACSTVLCST